MAGQRRSNRPSGKPGGKGATKPRRSLPKRLLRGVLIVGVVLALLGALSIVVLYKAIEVPNPNKEFETQTTHVFFADRKTTIGEFSLQKRDRITYAEMPQSIKDAVVAAEDRTFWTNPGIDLKGIIRAGLSNASGNSTQGASTITQQYVKILYLTQERSYERKIKEAVVARKIAKKMSKDEVLEGYLNTIYFGRGAYGIQAAAVTWFGVPASKLTLRQSVVLASVINNPTQFDPANGKAQKEALQRRMKHVLDGMVEMDTATAADAAEAGAALPKFAKQRSTSGRSGQRGHAMDLVKKELIRLGVATEAQIDGGGLRVFTTLDQGVMRAAEQGTMAVRPKGLKELHAAVASVEPGTGALRGFYAGQDYAQSQINWAIAGGQVGSTFKPFALAAGLKAGYSLKDTFDGNSPYYYNGKGFGATAVNEDAGHDWGRVNLIKATEHSINSAYADLTMSIPDGPDKIIETANALGIPKDGDDGFYNLRKSPGLVPVSSVALGSAKVAPVNMANAYASFADGGKAADVYVIDKVVDANGEVLYQHQGKTKEAVSSDIAADVTYAMQQVIKSGTGVRAAAIGRPAAGKTGTATADNKTGKDHVSAAWFVGYTPQLSTAVMYTRGKGNEPLDDGFLASSFGGYFPAMTWAQVMRSALEGEPVEYFPKPAYVDGDAPRKGHIPIATSRPNPNPKPTPSASVTASPSASATTKKPIEKSCAANPKQKKCQTATPTPTPTASPSTSPSSVDCFVFPNDPSCPQGGGGGGNGNGGGGGGNSATSQPRLVTREEYAAP